MQTPDERAEDLEPLLPRDTSRIERRSRRQPLHQQREPAVAGADQRRNDPGRRPRLECCRLCRQLLVVSVATGLDLQHEIACSHHQRDVSAGHWLELAQTPRFRGRARPDCHVASDCVDIRVRPVGRPPPLQLDHRTSIALGPIATRSMCTARVTERRAYAGEVTALRNRRNGALRRKALLLPPFQISTRATPPAAANARTAAAILVSTASAQELRATRRITRRSPSDAGVPVITIVCSLRLTKTISSPYHCSSRPSDVALGRRVQAGAVVVVDVLAARNDRVRQTLLATPEHDRRDVPSADFERGTAEGLEPFDALREPKRSHPHLQRFSRRDPRRERGVRGNVRDSRARGSLVLPERPNERKHKQPHAYSQHCCVDRTAAPQLLGKDRRDNPVRSAAATTRSMPEPTAAQAVRLGQARAPLIDLEVSG